jgi:tetratricopeptide (TPR) repeat protein
MRQALVFSFVALLMLPSHVAAQPENLAKNHYLAGKSYYQQGRYTEAIREFEEAHRLSNRPELLYNIAQAYEKLGNLEQAVKFLEQYLEAPDLSNRVAAEEHLKNLKARLKVTGIQITCNELDAIVLLDGDEIGRTPLRGNLLVKPGFHDVKVTKKGYISYSAFVTVSPGQVVVVKAQLKVIQARSEPIGGAEGSTDYSDTHRRKRIWTWVALGVTGAAAVTAGVTGGLALSKANEAQTKDDEAADSARTLALVSDITMGVAVAGAVATVVLFFVEGRSAERPRSALLPVIGPGTVGLSASF